VAVINKKLSFLCVTTCVLTNTDISNGPDCYILVEKDCYIVVEKTEVIKDKILCQSDMLVQYMCTEWWS
jgi:hypothetical protein